MERLRVLIPTCGRTDLLERTLRSLSECEWPPSASEVVVVENGAPAGAEEVVRAFDDRLPIRYLHLPQANKSLALNAALEECDDEEWLLFFDDDIRFDPQVLMAYARAISLHRGAFFGGPFGIDYEEPPPKWMRKYLPRSAKGWEGEEEGSYVCFLGFNWAAQVGDLRKARGFSSHVGPGSPWGMAGQETEMQSRLKKLGLVPRFVPDARVWHYVPPSRCSAQWAIERVSRHASYRGYYHLKGRLRLFGVPLGVWLKAATRALRRHTLARVVGDQRRFVLHYKYAASRGLIRGARLAKGKDDAHSLPSR